MTFREVLLDEFISKKELVQVVEDEICGEIKRMEFHYEEIDEEECKWNIDWLEPIYSYELDKTYLRLYCTRIY